MIGGMWDEIGELQLRFLVSQGLRPDHDLLDIGCGCLRGGVRFVDYLDAGRYAGVDSNPSLLAAGYDLELAQAGLVHKLDRSALVASDQFEFEKLGRQFDFAIAQSVFTHLDLNRIRRCLAKTAEALKPGGRLFATFFEGPADASPLTLTPHLDGIVTKSDADPYHYHMDDFRHAARGLPLEMRRIGDWGHPRGQRMLEFISTRTTPSSP